MLTLRQSSPRGGAGATSPAHAANARDPNTIEVDGRRVAAELVYGQRMSETLARLAPENRRRMAQAAQSSEAA